MRLAMRDWRCGKMTRTGQLPFGRLSNIDNIESAGAGELLSAVKAPVLPLRCSVAVVSVFAVAGSNCHSDDTVACLIQS